MKLHRVLGWFVVAAALVGCVTVEREGSEAPDYAPPPAQGAPLTREEALAVAEGARDPEDAIRRLDRRRLGFTLDDDALRWFREHGAAPEIVDYLEKRRGVDWDGTRGDIDPDTPQRRAG